MFILCDSLNNLESKISDISICIIGLYFLRTVDIFVISFTCYACYIIFVIDCAALTQLTDKLQVAVPLPRSIISFVSVICSNLSLKYKNFKRILQIFAFKHDIRFPLNQRSGTYFFTTTPLGNAHNLDYHKHLTIDPAHLQVIVFYPIKVNLFRNTGTSFKTISNALSG